MISKVAAVVALAIAAPASATVVDPGHAFAYVTGPGFDIQDVNDLGMPAQAQYGSALAQAAGSPTPLASVSISDFPGDVYASAIFYYYAQVDGPYDIDVPVHIQGRYEAGTTGPGGADTQLFVKYTNAAGDIAGRFNASADSGCSSGPGGVVCTGPSVTDVDTLISVGSNSPFLIEIDTELHWQPADDIGAGQAYARGDPVIFIDRSFPLANLFSISVSPGVANPVPASGVPEPASWLLSIAGLGLAGAVFRRRSRPVRPDAAGRPSRVRGSGG